jgi:hypothetical protein
MRDPRLDLQFDWKLSFAVYAVLAVVAVIAVIVVRRLL